MRLVRLAMQLNGGAMHRPDAAAPRVLWVTTESPDRNLGGGSIREAYLLEALARRAHVHLLLVGQLRDDVTRAVLGGITELDPPPPLRGRSLARRRVEDLRRVLVDREASEVVDSRAARAALEPALRRLLADPPAFDLVCVEHHGLAPLLPAERGQPWVMTMHNLPSQVADQLRAVTVERRTRWLLARERDNAAELERWISQSYDMVFTCSPDDAECFAGASVMIPNGVDADRLRPTPLPPEPRLVLTATLGYRPNVDGAIWFCGEVLPQIRQVVPAATLDLVGRSPVQAVTALTHIDGVSLHADVPEIRPYLERARVALVPIRVGSGTRLKALDAMAAGRPVVGTTIGLAGLGLVDGVEAIFADDGPAMARAVVALLRDDALASSVGAAGRRVVEQRFRWDRIGDRFAASLLDIVD